MKYYSKEAINAELPNETLYENLKNNNKNNLNSITLKYYGDEISYGFLFMVGRMKRFMFVGAGGTVYKVLPKTIEDVIIAMPEVQEVCVVSVYNGSGFAPKVYVVLKEDCSMPQEDVRVKIRAMCEEALLDYMRPYVIEFLDNMPKTAVGKVDVQALESMS